MKSRSTLPYLLFTCILSLVLAGSTSLSASPVDILPGGPYPVASSNLEVNTPTTETIESYMIGAIESDQSHYISDLLSDRASVLSININIPNSASLYGSDAGRNIPIVGYIVYPTTAENDREDYVFPYTNTADHVFPHMDRVGEDPIPAYTNRLLPLIIYSHGYNAHGLWDLDHMKYLASHGYIALSIFHGDGRFSQFPCAVRTLMVRSFLTYLLNHPKYGPMIDPDRIGLSGASLGGFTTLAILGGLYHNDPATVTDPRIKAGFGIVPWIGGSFDYPFLQDFSTLANVTVPFMAVFGEKDSAAPPEIAIQGLQQTSGITIGVQYTGVEHQFTQAAWEDTRTLEVLFFDSFLKDATTTRQILLNGTQVVGGVEDQMLVRRIPGTEVEPETTEP